jgi:hypothetical protein
VADGTSDGGINGAGGGAGVCAAAIDEIIAGIAAMAAPASSLQIARLQITCLQIVLRIEFLPGLIEMRMARLSTRPSLRL